MPKRLPSKALRLAWIKRRARQLKRFGRLDITTAVTEATNDWFRFQGLPLRRETLRRYKEVRA